MAENPKIKTAKKQEFLFNRIDQIIGSDTKVGNEHVVEAVDAG